MPDSAEITRAFYRELGAGGLAAQTEPEWDRTILERLERMLRPGDRVADIGCGYGRIAIPLARRGYHVTGLDLSAEMLAQARVSSVQLAADVTWREGTMCDMPLADEAFHVVLCMWSAFYELLEHAEQLAALTEMYRILRPGGWGLIDGPIYQPATAEEQASGVRCGPQGRLAALTIQGLLNMHFAHDPSSLEALAATAGLGRFRVELTDWGGYLRQSLSFAKPA